MKKLIPLFALLAIFFGVSAQPIQIYNHNVWFTSTTVPYSVGGGHGIINGTMNVSQGMFVYGEFDGVNQSPPEFFLSGPPASGGSAYTKSNVALITAHKIIWYNVPIVVYSMSIAADQSTIWFYGKPDQNGHSICIYDVATNTYSLSGRIADSVGPGEHGFISVINNHTAFIGGNMLHYGTDVSSNAFLYSTDSDVVTPLTGIDSIPSSILGMATDGNYTYLTFRNNASGIPYAHIARYNSATKALDAAFSFSSPNNFEMNRLLVHGNDLYAVGYDQFMVSTIWRCDLTTLQWSAIATPGAPVTSLSFDGKYIEVSGEFTFITSTVNTNGIATYDPQTGVWSQQYSNYSNDWYRGIDYIDSNLIAIDPIGNIMTTKVDPTGIYDTPNDHSDLSAYPNPANTSLHVQGEPGLITLTDILGNAVFETNSLNGDLSINTASYPRGLYILKNNENKFKITLQ